MTVRTRNIIYWLGFIWIILAGLTVLFIGASVIFPDQLHNYGPLSPFITTSEPAFTGDMEAIQFFLNNPDLTNILRVLLSAGGALLVSAVAAGVFIRFFRRITASHLLFLYLFLFSLSGELIKALALFLHYLGTYESTIMVLSRISLGMYLTGLLSGFTISLYLLGVKYQHQGVAIFLIVGISAAIAVSLPIDNAALSQNFLYMPAFHRELLWVAGGIVIITSLGYLYHVTERFSRQELVRVISAFMFLLGHALLYFTMDVIGAAVGATMVVTGLILYYLRLFYDYFWY